MDKKFQKPIDHMNLEEYMAYEDYLRTYGGTDRVVSSNEVKAEILARDVPVFKIKLGLPSLENMLQGAEEGELFIITGPTGSGKTTTALDLTRKLAVDQTKCLWFSYEMSYSQLIKKMVSNENVFEFFIPREMVTNHLDFIERKIMEARAKFEIRTIFIDHLSMLYSLEKYSGRNTALELGDIVAKIKNLALKHGIVIFLLAHTKKIEAGMEIFLEDIRDSGHIANLSDAVITVQRIPNDYKEGDRRIGRLQPGDNRIRIKVEKNRREGTQGSLVARYDKGTLTELPRDQYDAEAATTRALHEF